MSVTLGTTESSASRKIAVLKSSHWIPDMTSDTEMRGGSAVVGVGVGTGGGATDGAGYGGDDGAGVGTGARDSLRVSSAHVDDKQSSLS